MSTHPEAATALRTPPGPMSLEEFHAWCDGETRAEWVDGEVIVLLPDSLRHYGLVTFLLILLRHWTEAKNLGRVFDETVFLRLALPSRRQRVPDLIFVANAHLDRLQPTYVDGTADLVVEVISPDSVRRDRIDKLREYELARIPEYWLLDPDREEAELYELGADGRYVLAHRGRTGLYISKTLAGFPLNLEWLWQDPPPPLLGTLRELGLL